MSRVCTKGWAFQTWKEQKGLVKLVGCGQVEDGTIESNKDRNLSKTRQATGKRIDFVGLVDFGNLLIHHFRIALVLVLNFLDCRLESLQSREKDTSGEIRE